MEKIKVTFSQDVAVLNHLGEVEVEFKAGKSYTLPQTSADRWVRRGKAELAPKAKTTQKTAG